MQKEQKIKKQLKLLPALTDLLPSHLQAHQPVVSSQAQFKINSHGVGSSPKWL
jgi:hypothetical protein